VTKENFAAQSSQKHNFLDLQGKGMSKTALRYFAPPESSGIFALAPDRTDATLASPRADEGNPMKTDVKTQRAAAQFLVKVGVLGNLAFTHVILL
jgi:hypothetical protein